MWFTELLIVTLALLWLVGTFVIEGSAIHYVLLVIFVVVVVRWIQGRRAIDDQQVH
jgi:hypothetical protein